MKQIEDTYYFSAKLRQNGTMDAGYIIFPADIRQLFGKGRVKVDVTFDNIAYRGSIVNMGVKDEVGEICYIIGVRKEIRHQLNKKFGDFIDVSVRLVEE